MTRQAVRKRVADFFGRPARLVCLVAGVILFVQVGQGREHGLVAAETAETNENEFSLNDLRTLLDMLGEAHANIRAGVAPELESAPHSADSGSEFAPALRRTRCAAPRRFPCHRTNAGRRRTTGPRSPCKASRAKQNRER
jgi:hypothetical protein